MVCKLKLHSAPHSQITVYYSIFLILSTSLWSTRYFTIMVIEIYPPSLPLCRPPAPKNPRWSPRTKRSSLNERTKSWKIWRKMEWKWNEGTAQARQHLQTGWAWLDDCGITYSGHPAPVSYSRLLCYSQSGRDSSAQTHTVRHYKFSQITTVSSTAGIYRELLSCFSRSRSPNQNRPIASNQGSSLDGRGQLPPIIIFRCAVSRHRLHKTVIWPL